MATSSEDQRQVQWALHLHNPRVHQRFEGYGAADDDDDHCTGNGQPLNPAAVARKALHERARLNDEHADGDEDCG